MMEIHFTHVSDIVFKLMQRVRQKMKDVQLSGRRISICNMEFRQFNDNA